MPGAMSLRLRTPYPAGSNGERRKVEARQIGSRTRVLDLNPNDFAGAVKIENDVRRHLANLGCGLVFEEDIEGVGL